MTDTVEVLNRGRIAIITISREAKRNAIDASVSAGLDQAFNEFEDDPEQWCAILTGGTQFFCAGADLASGAGEPTPRGGMAGLIRRNRSKPLIAAVEGFALGGGLELVLCCDMVVASTTARFGLPEVARGLMPDFGGAFRIVRALPQNIAREILLTAKDLTAERAERLGFVNRLVAPGHALEAALELAGEVCANAPLATRGVLSVANTAVNGGDDTELWRLSDDVHEGLVQSDDLVEGVSAFFERRAPRWTGR
jgi:enoyl-CoA hydratase/carnithine racemase